MIAVFSHCALKIPKSAVLLLWTTVLVWVDLPRSTKSASRRALQFEPRLRLVPVIAEGLAEIAVKKGPVRLERGGDLKIAVTLFVLALANQAEPVAEPGVAQRAVDRYRVLKSAFGFVNLVLRAKQESEERMDGWVAWRELHTFLECGLGLRHSPKAEM